MTFEEWFNKEYPEGLPVREPLENYEGHVSIKELMKEAWDGRYNTLTYHDL